MKEPRTLADDNEGGSGFALTQPGQPWPAWVQGGLSVIPGIGGPLSTYFGERRDGEVQRRIQTYFAYIGNRLSQLDREKLDAEFLESDEFGELFARGAEGAARATSDERLRRFANIVLNNMLASRQARERATGLFEMVNRLSDLDAFVLLCFGPPDRESLKAESRREAIELVKALARHLGRDLRPDEAIVDSFIYMDNLGVTWVSQHEQPEWTDDGASPVKEFSVFRPPLGDAVAGAIAPPGFFVPRDQSAPNAQWPEELVARQDS
jgi:hypothetical protein